MSYLLYKRRYRPPKCCVFVHMINQIDGINGDTLIHLLVAVVRGFPSQDTPSLSLSLGVFAALSEWILLTPHLLVLVDGLFVVLFFLFLALLFPLKPLLFFYSLLLPCLSSLCRGPDNPGPEIHQCVP